MLARLGDDGAREIHKRVRAGQLGIIFPYLERRRNDLIAYYEGWIRFPFETQFALVHEPADLELSGIRAAVGKRIDAETRSRLKTLVDMRNALAHGECVLATDIQRACSWTGLFGGT